MPLILEGVKGITLTPIFRRYSNMFTFTYWGQGTLKHTRNPDQGLFHLNFQCKFSKPYNYQYLSLLKTSFHIPGYMEGSFQKCYIPGYINCRDFLKAVKGLKGALVFFQLLTVATPW